MIMLRLCCSKLLWQAALLSSFPLTAAASCFVKQLSPDCCSHGLALGSSFYILGSFLLYLLFMLLVLVYYTHMTCFYAGSDITKSIHRHQRCKRHTWKFTMHRIASQLHPEKSRVKFFTCPRLPRSEITISAFHPLSPFLFSIMHGRSRTSWSQGGFVAAACQRTRWFVAAACCTGVIKIWRWGDTVVDVGVSSERRRRYGEGSRRYI